MQDRYNLTQRRKGLLKRLSKTLWMREAVSGQSRGSAPSRKLPTHEVAVQRVVIAIRDSFTRRALPRDNEISVLPSVVGRQDGLTRSKVGVVGQLAQAHRIPTISFLQPPHLTPRWMTCLCTSLVASRDLEAKALT